LSTGLGNNAGSCCDFGCVTAYRVLLFEKKKYLGFLMIKNEENECMKKRISFFKKIMGFKKRMNV